MPKPSNAYGDRIEHRGAAHYSGMGCANGRRCPGAHDAVDVRGRALRVGSAPVYSCLERYVVPRKGGVTYRYLDLCQPCAEKFAKRHGMTLPEPVTAHE